MTIEKVTNKFDWQQMKKASFAVVVLEGDKGSKNHAVAITINMIFDSNETEAIRLCHAGLCYCLDPLHEEKFLQIDRG